MATAMESGERIRNSDLCDEPADRLLVAIRGYEDKPILPLTETVQHISTFFNDIEDYIYVALHNCKNPADGLNQQESASIQLYTMQFNDGPSLYYLLNQSLRAENRDRIKTMVSVSEIILSCSI